MGSAKLTMEELRAELSIRGLNTAGKKSTLVRRLDAALGKEKREKEGKNYSKKRPREYEEDDGDVDIDQLGAMGIRELRDLAKSRGLSINGIKRELIQRISNDLDKKDDGANGVDGDMDKFLAMGMNELRELAKSKGLPANGSKMDIAQRLLNASNKARKRGDPVLDEELPNDIKSTYHILKVGEEIYHAALNQANIDNNNNKFYIIQALESDDGKNFRVFNRWGRVGVRGQKKLHGPFETKERAISEFESKFFKKTKIKWCNRGEITKCYPKLYTWVETEHDDDDQEKEEIKKRDKWLTKDTKLAPRIASFIKLICSIDMMQQQMMEIGYDASKSPIGKLSKSTILKGYDVLRKISDVIGQNDRSLLKKLSEEFYTVIPHDFGFQKLSKFVIDTRQLLKSKLEMVQALGEIEIATKLLEEDSDEQDDPLYAKYKQLQCELAPVEPDSQEFSLIKNYVSKNHGKTHLKYKVDIEQIFKVSRHGETEQFEKFSGTKNRMLLWHGSRLCNWIGILSQGLRIAPPEAPVTGYMFGKGVYFADMFSKSAKYCNPSKSSTSGVILLCEVALGEMNELFEADYNANNLPNGKLSTKGVGKTEPDNSCYQILEDGLVVPIGKPTEDMDHKGALKYNEYIVYKVDQIKMRYILQVNFNKFKC